MGAFYKALSDPTRLRIVDYLLDNADSCICKLLEIVQRDQSVVSRHIDILNRADLIILRKEGRYLYCRIKNKVRKLLGV